MKQSNWLPGVAKNCDWCRKITLLRNLAQASLLSRIQLRNLQILNKILKKASQFLSSEQPCESDVP